MAKPPEHGDRSQRGRRFRGTRTLGVVAVTVSLAVGCSSGGGPPASSAPPKAAASPSAPAGKTGGTLREKINRGLIAEGRADKASLALQPGSTQYEEVKAPVLGDAWQVYRFDTTPDPAAGFYVAIGPRERVFYLTQSPKRFTALTGAAAVRVASDVTAADLAELYVETTRPMQEYSQVVTSVDDLEVASGLTGPQRAALKDAQRRLRPLLGRPLAERAGDGYTVTLYVQRGAVVERRTLGVSATGEITERPAQPVIRNLPAPLTA